jgi:hypothetical protein
VRSVNRRWHPVLAVCGCTGITGGVVIIFLVALLAG